MCFPDSDFLPLHIKEELEVVGGEEGGVSLELLECPYCLHPGICDYSIINTLRDMSLLAILNLGMHTKIKVIESHISGRNLVIAGVKMEF